MGVDAEIKITNVPNNFMVGDELTKLSFGVCRSLGAGLFWMEYGKPVFRKREEPNALDVQLLSSWYSVGYERGPILEHISIAEWVEHNIPNAIVWYGNDHSEEFVLFDHECRTFLKKHLYSAQGCAYFREVSTSVDGEKMPAACGACPSGQFTGRKYKWGDGGRCAAYVCLGCGRSFETGNRGKSYQVVR